MPKAFYWLIQWSQKRGIQQLQPPNHQTLYNLGGVKLLVHPDVSVWTEYKAKTSSAK